MKESEFSFDFVPSVREGMSTIQARRFLDQTFPGEKGWTCWHSNSNWKARFIGRIPVGKQKSGKFGTQETGKWLWQTVDSPYPANSYWNGCDKTPLTEGWTGVIKVTPPADKGGAFLLFSFLDTEGKIGSVLFASTYDYSSLGALCDATYEAFAEKNNLIHVRTFGGSGYFINPEEEERIFMQGNIREDIHRQVSSFFGNPEFFRKNNIRYRRGFLLVGPPGTGKTMQTREIIRQASRDFKVSSWLIRPSSCVDEEVLDMTFFSASREAPAIIVMEDVDTFTKETRLTRSGFLSALDGLESKNGILVVASTNNPEDVDPALAHRPSRFDRVYHFPVPDYNLRKEYCSAQFKDINPLLLERITVETKGWSFAFLNELKTSAAIVAMSEGSEYINEPALEKALLILSKQYKAGKNNHLEAVKEGMPVGFSAA